MTSTDVTAANLVSKYQLDAPAHHIFCLLGPISPDSTTLPEVRNSAQRILKEG